MTMETRKNDQLWITYPSFPGLPVKSQHRLCFVHSKNTPGKYKPQITQIAGLLRQMADTPWQAQIIFSSVENIASEACNDAIYRVSTFIINNIVKTRHFLVSTSFTPILASYKDTL
jgi:hypothetical protein